MPEQFESVRGLDLERMAQKIRRQKSATVDEWEASDKERSDSFNSQSDIEFFNYDL